uniref:Uncharacterized protein n=1 Tax=Strongyloides papillosus TaxID=174720 RepID=A0A0N5BAC8_STREA
METASESKSLTASEKRELRRQKILGNTEGRIGKLFGVTGVRPEAAPAIDGITQSQLQKTINTPVNNEVKKDIPNESKLFEEYKDKELEEMFKKIDNLDFNKLLKTNTFSMRANISLVCLVVLFSLTGIPFLPTIFLIVISNVMVEIKKTSPNVDKVHLFLMFMESMKRLVVATFIYFIFNILFNYFR